MENRILIQYLVLNSAIFFGYFEWDKISMPLYEKTTKLRGPTLFKVKVNKTIWVSFNIYNFLKI